MTSFYIKASTKNGAAYSETPNFIYVVQPNTYATTNCGNLGILDLNLKAKTPE